ncbi:hypothetical protein EV702DRAFT_1196163 [Suillus placidus]|uniref:Uncharacterized protein n=1 Tax=Suillus placidus TaxID=48579 RepID=A0A9P7D3A6_9AGAM|nr:hypothetical protein EV702DRAFT_1196163 [Suillus placidus]
MSIDLAERVTTKLIATNDIPSDCLRLRGKSGRQSKTGKKLGRTSAATMDETSDHSDDDNVLMHRRKPTKKTAQKHSMSKPRISSEESADEFRVLDSSEESSDDEILAGTNGKASVKGKTRGSGRNKTPLGIIEEEQPSAEKSSNRAPDTGHKANASDTVQEPSASRAPPTPINKPRRVEPASCPGGVVRHKPGDKSKETPGDQHPGKRGGAEVAAPSSPKKPTKTQTQGKKRPAEEQLDESPAKCTKVQAKGKKCPAEDLLDESPAKCTRSKTTDVPPKRSKKPNSKYAGNFVHS